MTHSRNDEDEGDSDHEAEADDFDTPDGEDDVTIPCPYCHRPIHEESERCPHCGEYISVEDVPAARKPWWLLVGVAAGLYAVYRLIAH
jgi:hypothetical protein